MSAPEKNIQLFKPTFRTDECLEHIKECLDMGWTGMGFKTVELEDKWKAYTGHENAHYIASATVGLNLALEIFKAEHKWDDESEIITTPLTFISTNHAILHNNLKAVFADVDESLCLSPESVKARITDNTKAVMFVGFGGNTGRFKEVVEICKEYGLKIILDAAHMAGTRYLDGTMPGQLADVTVYSFQAVKNMPTADSGMICFADEKFDQIARKKSWLGINKDTYARATTEKNNYKWKYDVEYVGHKYHGNSIIASIGLVQLQYLDQDNEYRRQIASWYQDGLKDLDQVTVVAMSPECISSQHLCQIRAEKRDELLVYLNEQGIYPGVHYTDNTEYKMYSYANGTCPNSLSFSHELLSLPIHLRLTEDDVAYVVKTIHDFYKG